MFGKTKKVPLCIVQRGTFLVEIPYCGNAYVCI